jgi:ornithine cyclodeaminase/alanine dehydrogenase-like protein (mu-crystallin family)
MPPLTFDEATIRSLVTRLDALAAVRQALTALADERVLMPDELALALDAGEVHVKGGHLLGSPYAAFKVATGFPGNAEHGRPVNDGFSMALDACTGALAATLYDGGWLTDLRTGAAGALAADLLARPDATRVAVLGAGAQARFQLEGLLDVRQVGSVAVWNRTRARADAFAASVEEELNLPVTVADDVRSAVADADIVVTTTASRTPLLSADWLAPGTHVTAMGSDFPDKRELAADVLAAAGVVVADRVDVCARVGEVHHGLTDGVLDRASVVELADLVTGRATGRTGPDQITVADQCGLGAYDAAMVQLVLDRAAARS